MMANDATSLLRFDSWSNESAVRPSPAGKDVNMEAEESTFLKAVT
jgi:hypothetical protein